MTVPSPPLDLATPGRYHVVGVGAAEPVLAADRPDERGVPLDQFVPRLAAAVPGPGHQLLGKRGNFRRIR